MPLIDIAEAKWSRKTLAGFRKKWVSAVKSASSFEAFCQSIASFLGVPVDVVRSSLPAQNWKEFQANAEKYLDKALAKIEAAMRARKWSTNYKRAFTTGG